MRVLLINFAICGVMWAVPARADTYKVYDPADAIDYALTNYSAVYGSGGGQNPFYNYAGLLGGNCTNFVSQAIMAGLVQSDSMSTVYGQRTNYDIDITSTYYQWYFISDSSRGPAFTGANKLYEYADYNQPSYRGLHFELVTYDTLTEFMDYQLVEVGDVVFADWGTADGVIDHSMLVTDIQTWRLGYNEIRLTYQGAPGGVVGVTNIGLGDINEDENYEALFYVYRPVDYNPSGL
ncbi:MAG: amidase domain-containing protein [Patescibacteria group bacterium]